MSAWGPSWIDVTWGAGGSTSELTQEICHTAQNFLGLETMMHMTCTNMPKESIKAALQKARDSGIRNILALRGGNLFIVISFSKIRLMVKIGSKLKED